MCTLSTIEYLICGFSLQNLRITATNFSQQTIILSYVCSRVYPSIVVSKFERKQIKNCMNLSIIAKSEVAHAT